MFESSSLLVIRSRLSLQGLLICGASWSGRPAPFMVKVLGGEWNALAPEEQVKYGAKAPARQETQDAAEESSLDNHLSGAASQGAASDALSATQKEVRRHCLGTC